MRADPHSDMGSVQDYYEFEETLRPPSFVFSRVSSPTDFVTREIDIILPKQQANIAMEHPPFTDDAIAN